MPLGPPPTIVVQAFPPIVKAPGRPGSRRMVEAGAGEGTTAQVADAPTSRVFDPVMRGAKESRTRSVMFTWMNGLLKPGAGVTPGTELGKLTDTRFEAPEVRPIPL